VRSTTSRAGRFAITVDDAIADSVPALSRAAPGLFPQLFVPTAELGGSAHWSSTEPVADGTKFAGAGRPKGVAIAAHPPPPTPDELDAGELERSGRARC